MENIVLETPAPISELNSNASLHYCEQADELVWTDAADPAVSPALDQARAVISSSARDHSRLVSGIVFSLSTFTVAFTLIVQTLIRLFGDSQPFWSHVFWPLCIVNLLLLLAVAGGIVWVGYGRSRVVGRNAALLCDHEEKESVGSLIELFKFDLVGPNRRAAAALTRILPTLRASDAHLLTGEHRKRLNRILSTNPREMATKDIREWFINTVDREERLRVAILEAYQQVGDPDAVPIVRQLAGESSKASPAVRAAAKECLPYLLVRLEKHSEQTSLLRGSSPATLAEDRLLRPAGGSHEVDTGCLLRFSEGA